MVRTKNDEYFSIFKSLLNTRFEASHITESLNILINKLWNKRKPFLILLNIEDGRLTLAYRLKKELFNKAKTLFKHYRLNQVKLDYFSNLYSQVALNHIKWSLQEGIHSDINEILDKILQDFLENN